MAETREEIAAALTPEGKTAQYDTVVISAGTGAGTVLMEYDFEPAFVLIGNQILYSVRSGSSSTFVIQAGYYEYDVKVLLSGASQIMTSKDSQISASYTITCIAFR